MMVFVLLSIQPDAAQEQEQPATPDFSTLALALAEDDPDEDYLLAAC
jgi:hypothetical protein